MVEVIVRREPEHLIKHRESEFGRNLRLALDVGDFEVHVQRRHQEIVASHHYRVLRSVHRVNPATGNDEQVVLLESDPEAARGQAQFASDRLAVVAEPEKVLIGLEAPLGVEIKIFVGGRVHEEGLGPAAHGVVDAGTAEVDVEVGVGPGHRHEAVGGDLGPELRVVVGPHLVYQVHVPDHCRTHEVTAQAVDVRHLERDHVVDAVSAARLGVEVVSPLGHFPPGPHALLRQHVHHLHRGVFADVVGDVLHCDGVAGSGELHAAVGRCLGDEHGPGQFRRQCVVFGELPAVENVDEGTRLDVGVWRGGPDAGFEV